MKHSKLFNLSDQRVLLWLGLRIIRATLNIAGFQPINAAFSLLHNSVTEW